MQGRKKKDKKENGMESEGPATHQEIEDTEENTVSTTDTKPQHEDTEASQFAYKKKGGRLVRVP